MPEECGESGRRDRMRSTDSLALAVVEQMLSRSPIAIDCGDGGLQDVLMVPQEFLPQILNGNGLESQKSRRR